MSEMRDDAREERKRLEMKLARLFFIVILIPSICAASPQRATDVQATVQERIGKRVELNRDAVADQEIERAVRTMLRGTLNADRAVQIALLNNRELQATFEDIGIANADLTEAGLLKNPAFNASALIPDRPPSAAKLDFGITQEFLDLLMIPLRKKVAANELMRVELRVGDAVLKLAAEVRAAFYMLQGKQMLSVRLVVLGDTNAAALELALRQHEAGTINDLELANQQSTYSQSKLDAALVAAEIRTDREKLNRLMGAWGAETEWKMASELPALPANFATEHLESLAMEQRLDLAAAKAELGAVVQSLGLTKTYRYVGAIEFGVGSEREPDRQWLTGPTLRLELPIFNRGQGRIAKLKAQLRQAERRLEAAAIDIRAEVREARDRALAKKDLAAYYRDELVPERKRVLDLTLTSYNAMLKGPYDLLLARQNELVAERGYIEALRDYWIARADLERAVGGRLTSVRTKIQDSSKEIRTH
jgi:cobalt-zinc-cadmium efflux system outer membrane protein